MDNHVEEEIDLLDLFYYLKKKIAIILVAFLAFAMLGFVGTKLFITPTYTAATRMYVLSRTSESVISYSDLTASAYMVKDYEVLITGQNVTREVIQQLDLDMTHKKLSGLISVEAIDSTRVLQIEVVDTDPQRAADIANCVREVASSQILEIMDVDAVNLVYEAEVPQQKSGPSTMMNTAIAAALGLIIAVGVLVVIYLMDDTIRTEEDVERYLGLSTMGVIPITNEWDTGVKRKQGKQPQRQKK